MGEARKAIEYYERALAIAREIGDRRNQGVHLCNQGLVFLPKGNAQGHRVLSEALAIARDIGDRRNEGVPLGNLGLAI